MPKVQMPVVCINGSIYFSIELTIKEAILELLDLQHVSCS